MNKWKGDRQTDRGRDTQRETERDRETERQTNRQKWPGVRLRIHPVQVTLLHELWLDQVLTLSLLILQPLNGKYFYLKNFLIISPLLLWLLERQDSKENESTTKMAIKWHVWNRLLKYKLLRTARGMCNHPIIVRYYCLSCHQRHHHLCHNAISVTCSAITPGLLPWVTHASWVPKANRTWPSEL